MLKTINTRNNKMMKLEEIRCLLKDRRVSMVAKATGLHFNTIREVRDNKEANPTYKVILKLNEYLDQYHG